MLLCLEATTSHNFLLESQSLAPARTGAVLSPSLNHRSEVCPEGRLVSNGPAYALQPLWGTYSVRYTAVLTDLVPGQTYYYIYGSSQTGLWSSVRSFQGPPDHNSQVNILLTADTTPDHLDSSAGRDVNSRMARHLYDQVPGAGRLDVEPQCKRKEPGNCFPMTERQIHHRKRHVQDTSAGFLLSYLCTSKHT